MPLKSKLFKGDPKLEACLVSHQAHVVPGAQGEHVDKIQKALITLGAGVISSDEISRITYGASTARTVLAFKNKRDIIGKYQTKVDNIVGVKTIEALDKEMADFENRPLPPPASIFVATTSDGFPHDHSKCPRLQAGDHERTPINPQRFGVMVNLYGDHETDYLGFKDYAIDPKYIRSESGEIRPLTWISPERGGLRNRSASDICLRSVPLYDSDKLPPGIPTIIEEIRRIAIPGCRVTFAIDLQWAHKIGKVGPLIERVDIKIPIIVNGQTIGQRTDSAWVVLFHG